MTDFVLATGNPHKVDELRDIFAAAALRVKVRSLADLHPLRPFSEPAETGRTFEENAAIKARSYAAQTGLMCLADDSGIEIDALGGAPGVISSHYSTDGQETGLTRAQRDAANNARVMRELYGVPFDRRGARFVCCMCLASPDGTIVTTARGAFEGRIGVAAGDPLSDAPEHVVPRGENGFGYDPLFLVAPEHRMTSAELSSDEKNRLSHRAAAAQELARFLRQAR